MLCVILLQIFANASSTSKNFGNVITQTDITNSLQNSIPKIVSNIIDSPESIGLSKTDIENAYIGEPFNISNLDSKNDDNAILYYPIVNNNEIITIITLIKHNGAVSCTAGKDFSVNLNNVRSSDSDNNIILFEKDANILAVSETNDVYVVFEDKDIESSNSKTDFETTDNLEISDEQKLFLVGTNDSNIFETYKSDTNVIPSKIPVIQTLTSLSTSQTQQSEISPNNIHPRFDVELPDYPIVGQYIWLTQHGMCWASTMDSMLKYKFPNEFSDLTPQQICDDCGVGYDEGAYTYEVAGFLNRYLFDDPARYIGRPLSRPEVEYTIDNNNPAAVGAVCTTTDESSYYYQSGHMVALCGYDIFDDDVRIMDPAYECFKWTSFNSDGDYLFAFDDVMFKWTNTVVIYFYK